MSKKRKNPETTNAYPSRTNTPLRFIKLSNKNFQKTLSVKKLQNLKKI